jgi:hypothetical protein
MEPESAEPWPCACRGSQAQTASADLAAPGMVQPDGKGALRGVVIRTTAWPLTPPPPTQFSAARHAGRDAGHGAE